MIRRTAREHCAGTNSRSEGGTAEPDHESFQPDLPYTEVTTIRESVCDMFVNQRVLAWNSAAFGLMALLMATFGVYGVVSYSSLNAPMSTAYAWL